MIKPEKTILKAITDLKKQLQYLKLFGFQEIPVRIPSLQNYKINKPKKPLTLQEIEEDLGNCKRCKLWSTRTNIVFGVGNKNAEIIFVGEGPGKDEDNQGIPFVGKAGQLLTQIIEKGMGLKRSNVYICNIVKCRPPGNRDPEKDEIESCRQFLEKQIKAINPKVIVALGKPASSTLLGRNVAITKERGTWHSFKGYKLMLTYHPAYLLRQYTKENRLLVWEDMKKVLFNSVKEKINHISKSQGLNSILFVCLGNLCRSPMAEYMLRDNLKKRGSDGIKISSCGFLDQTGTPVPREIYNLMTEAGIDISKHESSPLSRERANESDLIIVMEKRQKEELVCQFLNDGEKVFLLSQFDKQNPAERDIADPMGKPLSDYKTCFNEIKVCVEGLSEQIISG